MCVVMEEKTKIEKNTLQAFEPVEIRVVEIAPQRMLCMSVEIEEFKVYSFEDAGKASSN